MRNVTKLAGLCVALLLIAAPAQAELPWQTDEHTRYMGLGDSLGAGFGAVPATNGYVYLLYQWGVFDTVPNTILGNASVPGATSRHVLDHQVPQAIEAFQPHFISLTLGGNDLLRILAGETPAVVLAEFQVNLAMILTQLRMGLPHASIVVGNLYEIPEIPDSGLIVARFNEIVAGVAGPLGVPVADVYGAFQGKRGLLLIERQGASLFQVHPTNAGYRAMAAAFHEAFEQ